METNGIEIVTQTEGSTQCYRSECRITCKGKEYLVHYSQEGDPVTLRFDSQTLQMNRTGETNISCKFQTGVNSTMLIGGYGRTGEIPVKTVAYLLSHILNILTIRLKYDLIFSDRLQTFQLDFKITTSEEK